LHHEFGRSAAYQNVKVEQVNDFDSAFDAFWGAIPKDQNIMAVRDCAYLNWRYGTNPQGPFTILRALRKGEMAGYLVWKTAGSKPGERSGCVMDLLTLPDADIAGALLHRVIGDALRDRLDNVKIAMLNHRPEWDFLRRQGFVEKSAPLNVKRRIIGFSRTEIRIFWGSR
jgi:hypothetical protein